MEILKVVSGIMLTLILASMLTFTFNIQSVRSSADVVTLCVRVPENQILCTNRIFTVTVDLLEAKDVSAYEFKLLWNATLLDLVAADVIIPSEWGTNYIIAQNRTDQDLGRYWLGVSALSPAPSINGNFTLVSLAFKAPYTDKVKVDYGGAYDTVIELTDTVLIDSAGFDITHNVSNLTLSVTLCLTGDIIGPNGTSPDGKVDIRDVAFAALRCGSLVGDATYDIRADITGPRDFLPDGVIDIRDIELICKHFGEAYIGEISILDDRFDTGLDNWVYWGGPGYVLEWFSNAAKISGDHIWPPVIDCGMQKVVDLSAWSEHTALLLSFDWRATSSYNSSCTTNARLWIQDANSNSSLFFLNLISGGTLDTGWQAYSSDISAYVAGHSNIRIILYLMDNYYVNFDQTNFYDNIKLKSATSP